MTPRAIFLWTGGLVGMAIMGGLRFLGHQTNIFVLLAGMALVIAILAWLIIRHVQRKW